MILTAKKTPPPAAAGAPAAPAGAPGASKAPAAPEVSKAPAAAAVPPPAEVPAAPEIRKAPAAAVPPPAEAPAAPRKRVAAASGKSVQADKVRYFWKVTGMTDEEFAAMVNSANNQLNETDADEFDSSYGVSRELILRILEDYVDAVKKRDKVCGEIVEQNMQTFLHHDACDQVLEDFCNEIFRLIKDRELLLSVLLNFVRSILRNDFVQSRGNVVVELKPGFSKEIWRQTADHYFRKG